jgi:hypothetical protein
MLHEVPNSNYRNRLLQVVELQRILMNELCNLAAGSVVNLQWLQNIWPITPVDWVERFWTLPKTSRSAESPGQRSIWIATIAAGAVGEKQTIADMVAEQLRFSEIYSNPPSIRLTTHAWDTPVMDAVNKLLKSFYDPLFYQGNGINFPPDGLFHKDDFIRGFVPAVKICPYTDNVVQDTKLDHFLPKDRYPMLSCHPDNLIPCSTDSNSGSHKGTEPPLDPNEPDQARNWFHPRIRNAIGKYRLTFPDGVAPQPRIIFTAIDPADQTRLTNMEQMFGLNEFWGKFLDDEVQSVASDITGLLNLSNKPATEANIRAYLLQCAHQQRRRFGRDCLAIVKSFFYEHIGATPVLFAQVVRACAQGT